MVDGHRPDLGQIVATGLAKTKAAQPHTLVTTSIMPPVASPLYTEAASTHEGLLRRFKDLSDYQIPRLRDCVGPLTLQQQYAAELREDVDALSKRLEVSCRCGSHDS